MVTATMKLKATFSLKESNGKPRQHFKKQRHLIVNKGPWSQGSDFPIALGKAPIVKAMIFHFFHMRVGP